MQETRPAAYFSMEIGLEADLPTYSGGLGVLAGDTLRAAADLGVPMVAVTLVHRHGYLRQRLDAAGVQTEEPQHWAPERTLRPVDQRVRVTIAGREVTIAAWRYDVVGAAGHVVPVYLLDTALSENAPEDRRSTDARYGGDDRYRLEQEVVLGIGGVALLRALGIEPAVYHMNEGHSALLTLALLDRSVAEAVRARCVFTMHTPVPAGHDRFPVPLAAEILGDELSMAFLRHAPASGGCVDMTHLAIALSRSVNAVAMRHRDVSREQYPHARIGWVTNGVHPATWVGPAMATLFDRGVPGWRGDGALLRHAGMLPVDEIQSAHRVQKAALLKDVARRSGVELAPDACTIVFARRATGYKRAALFLSDETRLRRLASPSRPLQLVFAGKAHPRDEEGQQLIARIVTAGHTLADGGVRIVYLADYDMNLARSLVGGADLWLNTPRKPLEASGTSGMKAALNGVPSLSVLDGWWAEGHVEGVTGWSIGGPAHAPSDDVLEAASLYDSLEQTILPLYYDRPAEFGQVRRAAIALNGSFFNTHRMVREYVERVYRPDSDRSV